MSGTHHRWKAGSIEREVVDRHRSGVHAERYPLSGSTRFRSGHGIDVYVFGPDEAPLVAGAKGCKNGAGFTTLEKWLGEYHLLILRRNHADPIIVFPWWIWARLLEPLRLAPHGKRNQSYKITVQRSAS